MTAFSQNRIVFFGTPTIAADTLRALVRAGFIVTAAVTQPDKPAGRRGLPTPPPVKNVAQELGIPVHQPLTFKDRLFLETLTSLKPDVCVVISYGKIFPDEFLKVAPLGFVNVHYSLLPKYRGASPLQTAMINGDRENGVTVALLAAEVDSGPILSQKHIVIPADAYHPGALALFGREGATLLIETLEKYFAGNITPRVQDSAQATFAPMLTRDDGRINWHLSAEDIYNRIRALSVEPGTWTTWKKEPLKIARAHPLPNGMLASLDYGRSSIPGAVSETSAGIVVAAGKGFLLLDVVQPSGGKEMSAESFANGRKDFINSVLE